METNNTKAIEKAKRQLYQSMLITDDEDTINTPPTTEVIVNGDTGYISLEDHSILVNREFMLFSSAIDKILYTLSNEKDKIKYNKDKNKFIFDTEDYPIVFTYDKDISTIDVYSSDLHMVIHNHDVGPLSSRRYILLLDYLSEIIRYTQ